MHALDQLKTLNFSQDETIDQKIMLILLVISKRKPKKKKKSMINSK